MEVSDRVWLVTFMHYDLGYFDDGTCRLEPMENPFGPKCYLCLRNELSPMCPEWTTGDWLTTLDDFRNWLIRAA